MIIYKTTYKKGYVIGELHFAHDGDLDGAVVKAKEWLGKRHLKHLHTVPFLIDLNSGEPESEDIAIARSA